MAGVDLAGQPVTSLLRSGLDAGMSMQELLAGTDCENWKLHDFRAGLDWSNGVRISENAHAHLGDAGMLAIGHQTVASPLLHYTFRGVATLGSPGDFYSWAIKGPLPRFHPCMMFEGEWPHPDVFAVRMTMRPGYPPSRAFMFLFEGVCQALVELCGYDPNMVHVEPIAGGYVLSMPSPQRVSLRKRLSQRIRARLSPSAVADVGEIQRELLDKLEALDAEIQRRKVAQAELEQEIIEREALAEQVAQTQRLRSVGLLAGGVAHDFNNILTAVRGNAELALMLLENAELEPALGHELESNLGEIIDSADRAAKLTHKLLIAGRRQAIEPVEFELEAAVADMLQLLTQLSAQAGVELEFRPQATPVTIVADLGQTEQILLNLCVNARDASSTGDVVTIETHTVELDTTFVATNPWAKPGHYARLRVRDRGVGMSTEVRERLFDPFFTTKSIGAGTGLGMSVVMGAVGQHGGLIEVTSKLGEGTVISVYLPLDGPPQAATLAPSPRP